MQNRSCSAAAWTVVHDPELATLATGSTTITSLQPNTSYFVQIWGRDTYGNQSSDGQTTAQTTNLDTIIHYVAASGSNNGVPDDPAQPWNSIVLALNEIPNNLVTAEATYVVHILDSSTYSEAVKIDKTTDATYNITIEAAAGETPNLQAPNNKHGFEVKCAYITIDGLSIEASSKWGVKVVDNEHFTIRNCSVFGGTAHNQNGIHIKSSDHSRVHDNRIHTNLTGVRISEDTDFTSLRNNLISDGDDRTYGVFIDKETDADTLINNTIVGYQIGIYVRGPGNNSAGDGHVIRNNIISDVDTGYDIDKDLGSTFAQLDYNDIDVRDGGSIGSITATTYATMVEWRVATGAEAASLSLDPLFVDTDSDVSLWDLHLQSQAGHWTSSGFVSDGATSPAIDVGDPADGSGVETSPHGSRMNQGAYGGTSQASLSGDVAVA